MKQHYIEISIYKFGKAERPRLSIFSVDKENGSGSGDRLYGAKFSDFPSIKTYEIPLTLKLIDEIRFELGKIRDNIVEEEMKKELIRKDVK